jgi:hypothetical protein
MQEETPSENTSYDLMNSRLREEMVNFASIKTLFFFFYEAESKLLESNSVKDATNNELHNDTHKNKSYSKNNGISSNSPTVNKKRKITIGNFALTNIIKDTIRSRDRMDLKERKLAEQKLNNLQERKSSNT